VQSKLISIVQLEIFFYHLKVNAKIFEDNADPDHIAKPQPERK